ISIVPASTPFTYQCNWYNLPYLPGSITAYKWECVPGTEYGQTMAYYQGDGLDEGPCETEHLNIPISLIDGNGERATTTQANGTQWDDVVLDQNGQFRIVEQIPAGFGDPMVFCGTLDDDEQQPVIATGGEFTIQPTTSPFNYQCNIYNIPYQDSTVTVRKWECPQDTLIEMTTEAHQMSCTQPQDGVNFTLTDTKGPRSMVTAGGQVQWTDVAQGAVTIAETVPPGYHPQPFVVCGWSTDNEGSAPTVPPTPVAATNGVHHFSIQYPATRYLCDWYNTFAGPGELTINKWTCPEGYDPFAWNADPKNDCTELTNGVTFILDQPVGVDLQTDTGDSINGAVYFGGLEPGAYTVTEIVPDGIAMVFVYDCVGLNTGAVHPMPLSVGPTLAMSIAGGDEIVCDWMNVPAYDPDFGWMTVYKYICWTPSYVSDVDCEVFEDGKAFDLEIWNGANWVGVASGTTNAAGQLTWINLDAGTYRLAEDNGTPCRIESNMLDGDANLVVQQNTGTIVKVYNCSTTPPVPGGKMPTKYPNTGVEPVGTSDDAGSLFAVAGLLGAGSLSRRQFLRRAAAPTFAVGAGSLLFGTGIARQTIVPIELPGAAIGTPGADCLFPATPVATPGATPSADSTPVACARGAVPMRVAIGEIEVDAEIEILETIGGEMQAPTGAVDVAWYKESARLGETGNILLAGHLNYWGVPEGVFFRLEALAEGDAVELEGDDGETYRYIVEWAENFPSDEEPPEETLGHTDNQSLTLITCGGEWSAEIAEYDHRTVVRAVRDVEPVG
ncbi:MAG: class F sortase, partial [Chloroflexota bacterium]|nr:class F sortase [Chloroflexota bacterium]